MSVELDDERLQELHRNPENPIARMILVAEGIGEQYGRALNRAEEAYKATHPAPPHEEAPPPPYDTYDEKGKPALTPAGVEWCRITKAQHKYWRTAMRAAKQDPEVVALGQEYDTLVLQVWDRVNAIGGVVGRVPGLGRCPACGAGGISVPQTLDHAQYACMAVCTLHEDHLIEWLPWGG